MPPDSLVNDNSQPGPSPPPLPASPPAAFGASQSSIARSPPPLPGKPGTARRLLANLLSIGLGLFLADAIVSLVDDSLILFTGLHGLTGVRGIVSLLALPMALVIYGFIGLAPMIPKRLFLPVALFNPVAVLVGILCAIYFHGRIQQIAVVLSLLQVILGLGILRKVQGGFHFRWPWVGEDRLGARGFSWRHLSGFLLLNVFVVLPALVFYLLYCAALAVDHFSDGFVALRPRGLTVQARKYVRSDGKVIQLFPMAHIGEPDFYRRLAASFPADSIILMEGVSDDRNLLTNRISYQRMATSLRLAEQQTEFKPTRGQWVRADVDIEHFATNTIDFLNLVMLFHAKGLNREVVLKLIQYSPPPGFEDQLFDDLLRKRNRRLLEELRSRLSQSEKFMIPWGAAHMPEIAKEIQKSGFRLDETREYVVIHFQAAGKKSARGREGEEDGKRR